MFVELRYGFVKIHIYAFCLAQTVKRNSAYFDCKYFSARQQFDGLSLKPNQRYHVLNHTELQTPCSCPIISAVFWLRDGKIVAIIAVAEIVGFSLKEIHTNLYRNFVWNIVKRRKFSALRYRARISPNTNRCDRKFYVTHIFINLNQSFQSFR